MYSAAILLCLNYECRINSINQWLLIHEQMTVFIYVKQFAHSIQFNWIQWHSHYNFGLYIITEVYVSLSLSLENSTHLYLNEISSNKTREKNFLPILYLFSSLFILSLWFYIFRHFNSIQFVYCVIGIFSISTLRPFIYQSTIYMRRNDTNLLKWRRKKAIKCE